MEERIKALRQWLHRQNKLYYVAHQPEVTDEEFDLRMRELEELEAAHPEWADPNSPTQRVGGDLTDKFEKVEHVRPMLSLSNTYNEQEVRD
jgi:DNA ligase (NAD+)